MGFPRAVWAAGECAVQKSHSPSAWDVQGHDREICRNSSWAVVQLDARSVVGQSAALRAADAPAAAIHARPNDSRAREAFQSDRVRNWRDPSTGRGARSRASRDDPCRFPWQPAISRTKRQDDQRPIAAVPYGFAPSICSFLPLVSWTGDARRMRASDQTAADV